MERPQPHIWPGIPLLPFHLHSSHLHIFVGFWLVQSQLLQTPQWLHQRTVSLSFETSNKSRCQRRHLNWPWEDSQSVHKMWCCPALIISLQLRRLQDFFVERAARVWARQCPTWARTHGLWLSSWSFKTPTIIVYWYFVVNPARYTWAALLCVQDSIKSALFAKYD